MTDRAGTYLFTDSECFDIIAQYMIDHGYPVHLNVPTVASAARAAYMRLAMRDLNDSDSVPNDWTSTADVDNGVPGDWKISPNESSEDN